VRESDLAVSVVVPTYRRPALLARCLDALADQRDQAREILIVRRTDDAATAGVLERRSDDRVGVVLVDEPGVLAAMRAGAAASASPVIAFTDDDAAPRADWIMRLVRLLADPEVGAAGGRDYVDHPTQPGPETTDVGRLSAWGRVVGNHHLGVGGPRPVDVLKGVNMAFRREALAFPIGLRGEGAQVHYEVACCLWARRGGWRLVYDPAAAVDHAVGPRFDADRRARPARSAVADAAYNLVMSVGSFRPDLLWRHLAFGLAVGDRGVPGVARAVKGRLAGEPDVASALSPAWEGRLAALRDLRRHGPVRMVQVDG
jgi:GT2 family glycosyltransferase